MKAATMEVLRPSKSDEQWTMSSASWKKKRAAHKALTGTDSNSHRVFAFDDKDESTFTSSNRNITTEKDDAVISGKLGKGSSAISSLDSSSRASHSACLSDNDNYSTPSLYAAIPAKHIQTIQEAFGENADLYKDVLKVKEGSSDQHIRIAYFRRGREVIGKGQKLSGQAKQRFLAVTMAYEIVSNLQWRTAYERSIITGEWKRSPDQPKSARRHEASDITTTSPSSFSSRSERSNCSKGKKHAIRDVKDLREQLESADQHESSDLPRTVVSGFLDDLEASLGDFGSSLEGIVQSASSESSHASPGEEKENDTHAHERKSIREEFAGFSALSHQTPQDQDYTSGNAFDPFADLSDGNISFESPPVAYVDGHSSKEKIGSTSNFAESSFPANNVMDDTPNSPEKTTEKRVGNVSAAGVHTVDATESSKKILKSESGADTDAFDTGLGADIFLRSHKFTRDHNDCHLDKEVVASRSRSSVSGVSSLTDNVNFRVPEKRSRKNDVPSSKGKNPGFFSTLMDDFSKCGTSFMETLALPEAFTLPEDKLQSMFNVLNTELSSPAKSSSA